MTLKPSLDIIIGPMFSGKSTELIRRLSIFNSLNFKVLYINCDLDNRSEKDFSTHSHFITTLPSGIDSIKIPKNNLNLVAQLAPDFDVFGIDEAQMFPRLYDTAMNLVESHNKKLIVSGLNGDFSRKEFGEILQLIPLCDDITKLHPYCVECRKKGQLEHAIFSKRKSNCNDQILIGADSEYIPVCRKCYHS